MKPTQPIFSFEPFVHADPDYLGRRFDDLTGRRAEKQKIAEEQARRKIEQDHEAAMFWNPVLARIVETLQIESAIAKLRASGE